MHRETTRSTRETQNAPAIRRTTKRAATCLSALGISALMGFGAGVATADVNEIGPGPSVKSRQASEFSVIRINDFGVARGVAATRLGESGIVSAQGEVRDSMMAVVGGRAAGFQGSYPKGPGMGDW